MAMLTGTSTQRMTQLLRRSSLIRIGRRVQTPSNNALNKSQTAGSEKMLMFLREKGFGFYFGQLHRAQPKRQKVADNRPATIRTPTLRLMGTIVSASCTRI